VTKEPHWHSALISNVFTAGGVFLVTEVATLMFGLLKPKSGFTPTDIALIICDVVCILATWAVLRSIVPPHLWSRQEIGRIQT
jgi:hypothetical protein